MRVKVYYQDFFKNCDISSPSLKIDEENAALMAEEHFDSENKEEICNEIFKDFNIGEWISTPEFQNKVENQPFAGKHTSMSVGDYVKFEDGEIWICDRSGWCVS